LPLDWAATAHPFRAADPGSGARVRSGPGCSADQTVRTRGGDGSWLPCLVLDEQDDYRDQTKHLTIARLGRFSTQLHPPAQQNYPAAS
jgi:hypothetical protein